MLDELESIDNVALICSKEKTTSEDRLSGCMFSWGDFRTKLDTATDDTTVLNRCGNSFEIRTWVGLPSMRCERASVLRRWIAREGVLEVVILIRVLRDGKVVLCRREIDGCSYTQSSRSGKRKWLG